MRKMWQVGHALHFIKMLHIYVLALLSVVGAVIPQGKTLFVWYGAGFSLSLSLSFVFFV